MAFLGRKRFFYVLVLLAVGLVEVWVFSRTKGDNERNRTIRLNLFALVIVMLVLSSRYVYKRLAPFLKNSSKSGSMLHSLMDSFKTLLLVSLILMLLLGSTSILIGLIFVSHEPHWLSLASSVCLGMQIFLTTAFIVTDISIYIWKKTFVKTQLSVSQKAMMSCIRVLIALIGALILVIFGAIGAANLKLEYVVVPVKGLNSHWNGTTVVQLSDVHLGPFIGRKDMESIVARVNQLHPDFVFITGDLVDSSVESIWKAVEPVANLKTKHGVFYCTGNHEYYTGDVDNWIQELPKRNIKPLINSRVCVLSEDDLCREGLYLAGIEDYDTRRMRYGSHSMDIHKALSGRQKGIPTIVLAHQPKAAAEAIMWKDVRLVLSGHTHAGQLLPFMIPVYLYNPFFAGLYNPIKDVYVYVSAGTANYHIPFRHYRPEITHITLLSI